MDSSKAFNDHAAVTALTEQEKSALSVLSDSDLMRKFVTFHIIPGVIVRMRGALSAGDTGKATVYEGQIQGLELLLSRLDDIAKEWKITAGGRLGK